MHELIICDRVTFVKGNIGKKTPGVDFLCYILQANTIYIEYFFPKVRLRFKLDDRMEEAKVSPVKHSPTA